MDLTSLAETAAVSSMTSSVAASCVLEVCGGGSGGRLSGPRGVVATGIFSMVVSVTIVGFCAHELLKLDAFWRRYHTNDLEAAARHGHNATTTAPDWGQLHQPRTWTNKDENPITADDLAVYLRTARIEQCLIVTFICIAFALLLTSVCLIYCARTKQRLLRLLVPWVSVHGVVLVYGSVCVVLDCWFYSFHGENNLELLLWASVLLGSLHCFKCVVCFYREESQPTGSTCALYSPRATQVSHPEHPNGRGGGRGSAASHGLPADGRAAIPVVLMCPPPYSKDPPAYSLKADAQLDDELDVEKPPEYSEDNPTFTMENSHRAVEDSSSAIYDSPPNYYHHSVPSTSFAISVISTANAEYSTATELSSLQLSCAIPPTSIGSYSPRHTTDVPLNTESNQSGSELCEGSAESGQSDNELVEPNCTVSITVEVMADPMASTPSGSRNTESAQIFLQE